MRNLDSIIKEIEDEISLQKRNMLKRLVDVEVALTLGGAVEVDEGEYTLSFLAPSGRPTYMGSLPHYTRNFHEIIPLIAGKEFRIGVSKDGDGEVAVWVPIETSKIPKIYKQEFNGYEISLAIAILFLRIEEDARLPNVDQ